MRAKIKQLANDRQLRTEGWISQRNVIF